MDVVDDAMANERHIDEGFVKMKAYELESEARWISHNETWEEQTRPRKPTMAIQLSILTANTRVNGNNLS